MSQRIWLAVAGLCGAVSVGADAAARHLLGGDPYRLDLAAIAARYGLLHAAALVGIVALQRNGTPGLWLRVAGWCIVAGMVLFCGSLLLLAADAPAGMGRAAPFGGTLLIAGWVALLIHAVSARRTG